MQTIKTFWKLISTFGKIGVCLALLIVMSLLVGAFFSSDVRIALIVIFSIIAFFVATFGTVDAIADYRRRRPRKY